MDTLQADLMKEFGFDQLPEDKQLEVFQRIGGVIFQGILIRALESMSDEQQDALDTFLADHPEDPEALMGYLKENLENFDELAADEVARFKASALEIMQNATA